MNDFPKDQYNTRFENIPTKIYHNSFDASKAVAKEIAKKIIDKADSDELCILGLATGSTHPRQYMLN